MSAYLFIAGFAAVGGGETLIQRRARWLASHGHHVFIACPEGPAVRFFEEAGARVMLLGNLELYPDAMTVIEWCALRDRVLALVDGHRIEAIETFNLNTLAHAAFIAPVLQSRVILDVIHPDSTSDVPDSVWRMLEERNAIIAINPGSLRPTEERLGRRLRASLVPVAVDTGHEEFSPRAMDPASPRLLTVARLVQDKRYVLALLDSVRALKSAFPGIHLDVVGDGPLRAEVEARIISLQLQGNVTLSGTVHPDQVHAHYENCDVFVGMGTAAVQAAVHSRPAIIAFLDEQQPVTPGLLNEMTGTEFGERMPGDVEKPWLPLLERLLSDGDFRLRSARAGHARVRAEFFIDAVMQRWLDVVAKVDARPMAIPPPLWFDPPSEQKLIARRFLYNNPGLYTAQKNARHRLRSAVGLAPFRPVPRS